MADDALFVARDQLRAFVERVERLEEEKKTIADDIKDVFAEAKDCGFDTKILKNVIVLRRKSEQERLEEFVWVPPGVPSAGADDWMAGGSYLVARKIEMLLEPWDRTGLGEQERVFGRDKRIGAPLTGGDEFTEPVFDDEFTVAGWRVVGNNHLRLQLRHAASGVPIDAIHFSGFDGTPPASRLHLAYQLETDDFRDRGGVQLLVRHRVDLG